MEVGRGVNDDVIGVLIGVGASIRINQENRCLPYAGLFFLMFGRCPKGGERDLTQVITFCLLEIRRPKKGGGVSRRFQQYPHRNKLSSTMAP